MKRLMVVGFLALAGCTKPHDCMHVHMGGAEIEFCSKDVQCIKSKDGSGSMKICQYTLPQEEKKDK